MRTRWIALALGAVLLTTLLAPSTASAASFTLLGSLSVTGAGGAALTTELTGFAVIANPGVEKTITQQLPPFTLPVFIDGDDDGRPGGPPAGARLLRRNLDTTIVLTNTTAASLAVTLTLRDGAGSVLGTPTTRTLAAHQTILLLASDLLP